MKRFRVHFSVIDMSNDSNIVVRADNEDGARKKVIELDNLGHIEDITKIESITNQFEVVYLSMAGRVSLMIVEAGDEDEAYAAAWNENTGDIYKIITVNEI